jgi:hypothetical protein
MKKFFVGMAVAAAAFAGTQVQAAGLNPAQIQSALNQITVADVTAHAKDVIDWQVGDYQNQDVDLMSFLKGSVHKEVTSEDTAQNAIWVDENMDLSMLGKTETKTLISRVDGHVIKMIVNGQEQQVGGDQSQIDIEEQSETTIEVPAGKFDCFYIKAKITQQGQTSEVEMWVNPVDVNMDGSIKTILQSQLGPVTMTLKDFGPRH